MPLNIPIYVYILFVVLIYIGYKRCFYRVIKVQRLGLLPGIFIFLSMYTMYQLFYVNLLTLGFLGFGGVIGIALGFNYVEKVKVHADHLEKLIAIPGDWTNMLLILGIFAFEFFLHYAVEASLSISKTFLFEPIAVTILGLIAGMAVGRNVSYFLKYRKSLHESLNVTK